MLEIMFIIIMHYLFIIYIHFIYLVSNFFVIMISCYLSLLKYQYTFINLHVGQTVITLKTKKKIANRVTLSSDRSISCSCASHMFAFDHLFDFIFGIYVNKLFSRRNRFYDYNVYFQF